MSKPRLMIGVTAFVLSGLAAWPAAGGSGGSRTASVVPRPADFTARVDNPWFPLSPGTTYFYRGVKNGQPARDVLTVTHRTRMIGGVPCAVVEDRLYLRGRLHERTTDWYSQDREGNVWYFGEATAELDQQGRVESTAGSWQAGRDGAKPGIFVFAHPKVGRTARQEFYPGQAEDHFRVLSINGTVLSPRAKSLLMTEEWTPLEPGVLDHKLYARGIGNVLELTVKGGQERLELYKVRTEL